MVDLFKMSLQKISVTGFSQFMAKPQKKCNKINFQVLR